MSYYKELKGYYIYEIPNDKVEPGTLIHGLMQEGMAYDFGADDGHTYIAILDSDTDTLDLMQHYHKNSFVLSMGAHSASIGSEIFERYLKGDISLDDIPPAPYSNDNKPAAVADTSSSSKPKPKTQYAPAPLPVKPTRPTIARRDDLRTTDGRLRYLQDVKRRRRIAEANKAQPK